MFWPSTFNIPDFGSYILGIKFSKVDFPEPLCPTNAVILLPIIFILISFKT